MSKERREHQSQRFTLEDVARTARELTLQDGAHVPMLIAQGAGGPVVLQMSGLPPTHEERAQMMAAAGSLLAQTGEVGELQEVFFIAEAWMSQPAPGERPHLPPSQDPARMEVLIVSGLDVRVGETRLVVYDMQRDDHDELVALERVEVDQASEGQADSPLLDAFVNGFQQGRRTLN